MNSKPIGYSFLLVCLTAHISYDRLLSLNSHTTLSVTNEVNRVRVSGEFLAHVGARGPFDKLENDEFFIE